MSSLSQPTFDEYAHNYDEVLNTAISASGETKEYFARGRMAWMADRLKRHETSAASVLDYGCGIGTATPLFFEMLGAESVLGVDVSPASIAVAASDHRSPRTDFRLVERHSPDGRVDLAFSNGVFHHIPIADRLSAVEHVSRSLRPADCLLSGKTTPGIPARGTACGSIRSIATPFRFRRWPAHDCSAEPACRILETTYLFIFPRALGGLRPLEPHLSRLPLGAQYLILARKPAQAQAAMESGR